MSANEKEQNPSILPSNASSHILYTIGYSRLPMPEFLEALNAQGISTIADVRSIPYSSRFRNFSRKTLEKAIPEAGIAYFWLGDELGGIKDGKFAPIATVSDLDGKLTDENFLHGCGILERELCKGNVCLLCAENEPTNCHRAILVGHLFRKLHPDREIRHIWKPKGAEKAIIESQKSLDARILAEFLKGHTAAENLPDAFDEAYAMLNAGFAKKMR